MVGCVAGRRPGCSLAGRRSSLSVDLAAKDGNSLKRWLRPCKRGAITPKKRTFGIADGLEYGD